jgi:hypothetical protein
MNNRRHEIESISGRESSKNHQSEFIPVIRESVS